jgi:hypothetical protein
MNAAVGGNWIGSKRSSGIMTSAERKDYVVLGNDGEPCPTCGRSTEIREHAAITQKQLRQQCYYSRWFVCTNPMCHGKRILPERYVIWNARTSAWDA